MARSEISVKTGIIILVFMRRAFIFEAECPTSPKIETETLELFFLTCLTETFFSLVVLVLGTLVASSSTSSIRHFLGQVVALLANKYKPSLLQGR